MLSQSPSLSGISRKPSYLPLIEAQSTAAVGTSVDMLESSAISKMRVLTKNNTIKTIKMSKVGVEVQGGCRTAVAEPLKVSEEELKSIFINHTHAAKGRFFKEKDSLLGLDPHTEGEPLPRLVAHPGLGIILAGPYRAVNMPQEEYAPARLAITVLRPKRQPSFHHNLPHPLQQWLMPRHGEAGNLLPKLAYTQRQLVGWYCDASQHFFAITPEAFDANVNVARLLKEDFEEWRRRGPLLSIADYKRNKKAESLRKAIASVEEAEKNAVIKRAYAASLLAFVHAERAQKKSENSSVTIPAEQLSAVGNLITDLQLSPPGAHDKPVEVANQSLSARSFSNPEYTMMSSVYATRRFGITNAAVQIEETSSSTPAASSPPRLVSGASTVDISFF